jgi:hypothetical protein
MHSMKIAAAAAALGLGLAAADANATIISTTWNGTLASGTDYDGIFGAPGGDLAGVSFSAAFTFDTTKWDYASGPNLLLGFTPFSPGSAILTINGLTHDFLGDWASFIEADNRLADNGSWYGVDATDDEARSYLSLYAIHTNDGSPTTIFTPFDSNFCLISPQNCGGTVRIGSKAEDGSYHLGLLASAGSPTYSFPHGGVPEPATWAMMIMGFALVGSTLRRRRAIAT